MGFPQYRYTPIPSGEGYGHRQDKIDAWAKAWTATFAEAFDGLTVGQRWDVYALIHEMRKRVEAGDYGPPIAYPQPGPRAQAELKLEAGG